VAVKSRSQHDLLGEAMVPESAYWGIHTMRAVENLSATAECASSAVTGFSRKRIAGTYPPG
jgi:aspartate ammonia-lyase